VNTISQPVSDQELKELMEEVKRLSNAKYDIKTRKIIDGFETYQK
jgi:DNA-binding TFAR19-related protein (PDSD5 family)